MFQMPLVQSIPTARTASSLAEPPCQRQRIERRVHLGVVVEVDDDVVPRLVPAPHPGGPLEQGGLVVMAADLLSLTLLVPIAVSLWFNDQNYMTFLWSFAAAFGVGAAIWAPAHHHRTSSS